jgi:lipopolysaccharide export LptBFGC system permease protein LptF
MLKMIHFTIARIGTINMTNRTKVLIGILALLTSFAAGRYSVQQPAVHAVTDITQNNDITTNKDEHKKIIIVKDKDKTTTTITDDTNTTTKDNSTIISHSDVTATPPKTNTLNLSVLAGLDIQRTQTVYGASVTKELIGPITMGVFGLTNGTVGVSIGLNF